MQQKIISETLNSYQRYPTEKWCELEQQMERWDQWISGCVCSIIMLAWNVMQYHDEQNGGVGKGVQIQGIWRKHNGLSEVRGDGTRGAIMGAGWSGVGYHWGRGRVGLGKGCNNCGG